MCTIQYALTQTIAISELTRHINSAIMRAAVVAFANWKLAAAELEQECEDQ